MPGYTGKNGVKNIKNCFIGINGKTHKVKSVWTNKNGTAIKIFECVEKGTFVTIKTTGEVFTSLNGREWIKTATINANNYLLTYGNGRFVCVGAQGKGTSAQAAYYSEDGITWIKRSGLPDAAFYDIYFYNGKFICVGYKGTFYSTDGSTWIKSNAGSSPCFSCVCGGGGIYVASDDNRYMHYSADGINWIPTYFSHTGQATDIVYGKDKFLLITANNIVYQSLDGKTWTQIGILPVGSIYGLSKVIYAKNKFIGAYDPKTGLLSTDGSTWSQFQIADTAKGIKGMSYGGGVFTCSVYNTGLYYSEDGNSWTQTSGMSGTCCDIAFSSK